jgi:hypothetical protein
MAAPQQENSLFNEGGLIVALNVHKQDQLPSFRAATSTNDVPRSTAQRRDKGTAPRRGSIAPNRRLTPAQEETLKQWILSMDQRGMPPRTSTVRQMASLLAAQGGSRPVGERWVYDFIKRHDDLQSKWNRKYDYQRAKREGFAATGLVPYSPDRILEPLHTAYQTPSPQRRLRSNTSRATEARHNIAELQQQTALLRRHLKQRTQGPPSPTEHALSQLVKGCEMMISGVGLLVSEYEKLRMENQRQKRKRAQERTSIARGGVLSGADGVSRAQAARKGAVEGPAEAAAKRPQRAKPRCSMCESTEHNARTCPRRQADS